MRVWIDQDLCHNLCGLVPRRVLLGVAFEACIVRRLRGGDEFFRFFRRLVQVTGTHTRDEEAILADVFG